MDAAQYMKEMAELWSQGGRSFMAAQQNLWRDMAERLAKPGGEGAQNLFDPQAYGQANEAFARLWSSASELSQTFTRNLQEGKKPDPLVSGLLGRIFDPSAWFAGADGMDAALNRLAQGPQLADMWNTERQMLNVFNAWTGLRRRSIEHNTVMLEAWLKAAGAFSKVLNEKADRNEALGSWRDVLALWVDTANTVLLETQRSEPYLKSQRELLKASTELRLAQQELAEFYSDMFGYPTRAELDDVHKALTELRREVRALERAGRARDGAQSEGPQP
ncbi:MAG: poly-beta-hydroxybutyrate polymerase subunit [Hyphomicrobiales bacterium]|nr:poly-beta-hydroxybutyrate polymerase subunit [Hyphomicrobiales bacterium]